MHPSRTHILLALTAHAAANVHPVQRADVAAVDAAFATAGRKPDVPTFPFSLNAAVIHSKFAADDATHDAAVIATFCPTVAAAVQSTIVFAVDAAKHISYHASDKPACNASNIAAQLAANHDSITAALYGAVFATKRAADF
jgi:hypothetical protein